MFEMHEELIKMGVDEKALEIYDLIRNYADLYNDVSFLNTDCKKTVLSMMENIVDDLKKYTVTKQGDEI